MEGRLHASMQKNSPLDTLHCLCWGNHQPGHWLCNEDWDTPFHTFCINLWSFQIDGNLLLPLFLFFIVHTHTIPLFIFPFFLI
jgi:hypothetical protein